MKRIGIFLLVGVLVAGMAGCTGFIGGGCIGGCYVLSITSGDGGSVATPGEGTFTYAGGKVVNLLAEPEDGYHFVSWTGDVGTVANVNSALTTITTDHSYSIRANFVEGSSPLGIDYTEQEVEQLIIVLVNNERQSNNLSALTEDPLLTSLAREHSISMVEHDFFGHDRWPGERPLTYNMSLGDARGENIAKIPTREMIPGPYLTLQQVCEWAVSGWMLSDGHRENILRPCFTETGVGVAFSEEGAFIYLYITQIFEGPYSE
jgi:uncharacterized protein YkwD